MGSYDTSMPTAMQLYNSAGLEGNPNVGANTAGMLRNRFMNDEQMYAPPALGPSETVAEGTAGSGLPGTNTYPSNYYLGQQPAAKYAIPTDQKEYIKARQAVRFAANSENLGDANRVQRTDPITDEEVNFVMQMKDQAELADFDRWVGTLINPRQPGELAWLRKLYPEFVTRRVAQTHADYQFAIKNQMIDQWGINHFDDLVFKYMVDQGKIKGPYLTETVPAGNAYTAGYLSPWGAAWQDQRQKGKGIRLPFASARWGPSAGDNENAWTLQNGNGAAGAILSDPSTRGDLPAMANAVLNKPARYPTSVDPFSNTTQQGHSIATAIGGGGGVREPPTTA